MALAPRKHGVTLVEVAGKPALQIVSASIWGIVAIASDADAAAFPLNDPVLIDDIAASVALAGEEGTLGRALTAIGKWGNSIGAVVRVAEGEGETDAEIAADQDVKVIAGLEKLRLAEQTIKVRPRILAAPGLDTENVAGAMELVAPPLNAIAYAASHGATPAEIKTYRDNFTARELFLIDGDFTAFDTVAAADVVSYASAHRVGCRAFLDRTVGYHEHTSNVIVPGVNGIVSPRTWDLFSADTEMGLINGADVTGLIQRDGYRFWGNTGCSVDPRFAFEAAVRTNQILRETIGFGVFPYIDRPLVGSRPTDIVESINALFRREVRSGRIVGAEAFLAEGNTPEQLALGKLRIGYRFTPCAPLEDLNIASEITDEFYADLSLAA